MPDDHPVRARSGPATGTTSSGRSPRTAGATVVRQAFAAARFGVVLLGVAVSLVAVLWLLAVLEDRARRRAGISGPAPCCEECSW